MKLIRNQVEAAEKANISLLNSEILAAKKLQIEAAEAVATFLTYTEVYKKAKQAGNKEAAEAAINAKQELNTCHKEYLARKAAESIVSKRITAAKMDKTIAAEERKQKKELADKFYIASCKVSEAKKKYHKAEAGSKAEAEAVAEVYENYLEKCFIRLLDGISYKVVSEINN